MKETFFIFKDSNLFLININHDRKNTVCSYYPRKNFLFLCKYVEPGESRHLNGYTESFSVFRKLILFYSTQRQEECLLGVEGIRTGCLETWWSCHPFRYKWCTSKEHGPVMDLMNLKIFSNLTNSMLQWFYEISLKIIVIFHCQ